MYITISLPRGVRLTPGAAGVLVAYISRRGRRAGAWTEAVCEAFSGPRGTLLLIRTRRVTAAVADYAWPYIHKYFTD